MNEISKIAQIKAYEEKQRKATSFDKLEGLSTDERDELKGKGLAVKSLRIYSIWLVKGQPVSTKKGTEAKKLTLEEMKKHINSRADVLGIDGQLTNCIEDRAENMLIAQRKWLIKFGEDILKIIEE